MATVPEWLEGVDRNGKVLDVYRVNKIRKKFGRELLPVPDQQPIEVRKDGSKTIRIIHRTNVIGFGPGTEYKKLADEFGVKPKGECDCAPLREEMDRLGVAGCQRDRHRLVPKLQENYDTLGIFDKFKAVIYGGLPPWLSLTDPVGSMFDEALSRAAEVEAGKLHEQTTEDRRLHDGEE